MCAFYLSTVDMRSEEDGWVPEKIVIVEFSLSCSIHTAAAQFTFFRPSPSESAIIIHRLWFTSTRIHEQNEARREQIMRRVRAQAERLLTLWMNEWSVGRGDYTLVLKEKKKYFSSQPGSQGYQADDVILTTRTDNSAIFRLTLWRCALGS